MGGECGCVVVVVRWGRGRIPRGYGWRGGSSRRLRWKYRQRDFAVDMEMQRHPHALLPHEATESVGYILCCRCFQAVRQQHPAAAEGPRDATARDVGTIPQQPIAPPEGSVAEAFGAAGDEVEDPHGGFERHPQQPPRHAGGETHAPPCLPSAIGRDDDATDALDNALSELLGAHVHPLRHTVGLGELAGGAGAVEGRVHGEQGHALAQAAGDLAGEGGGAADGSGGQGPTPAGEACGGQGVGWGNVRLTVS